MQFLSIVVALVTLGFAFTLSRSRRGNDRYGIVLVLLPLALATPLVALMTSGLVLIYAFRNAASAEGLDALTLAAVRAADSQYVGHLTHLVMLATLALVAIALVASRPAPVDLQEQTSNVDADADDDASTPRALSRHATALMVAAIVVCIAAVATLSEFQDRFVASPLGFVTAFDARDVSEFSTSSRAVEEQQRLGSNTLVVETFRTLVVVVLFLVLFDAFLVGSRSMTFTRTSIIVSVVLISLASANSARALVRQRALMETIEERLEAVAKARAESRFEDETDEDPAIPPPAESAQPVPR